MKRLVYADNSATTQVSARVLDTMLPFFKEQYGNPSSIYSLATDAKLAIIEARKKVADALGADPEEIYFTSCGTESDNWALRGAVHRLQSKGKKHIVTTVFEHHAVLHTAQALEKDGCEVTYIGVDSDGLVNPEDVRNAIREDTAIVSVMYANNEIGTIQPIEEIGAICREKGVLFHTDAVQAIGYVPIDVKKQNIDLLSLSAHKIHGPKGIGVLYIRKGVVIDNLMFGGAQEKNKRPGTENVAFMAGLGTAIEDVCRDIPGRVEKTSALRDKLIGFVLENISHVHLNGHPTKRLAGNVNISFEGVEGESLLLLLDQAGICTSSGSACTSGSLDPSHVLLSIGLTHEVAHGSCRITLGDNSTMEDVDYIIEKLPGIIDRLRAMSPLWERIIANEK